MSGGLTGQSAVIIGATSGIGRAMAHLFAREGAQVLVVGRNEAAGTQVVAEIRQAAGGATYFRADVSQWPDVQAMMQAAMDRYGRIDIVCSNAANLALSRIEEMSLEEWQQVQAVNLSGTFYAVKACLPHMKTQHYGRVVLTASITGPITGFPGCAHYAATKAGMLGFMRTAAVEIAPYGITINAVLPGNIKTEGAAALGEDFVRRVEQAIPVGKMGEPEDVAQAALFLASPEARYVTGQTLVVDGGQTLPQAPQEILSVDEIRRRVLG